MTSENFSRPNPQAADVVLVASYLRVSLQDARRVATDSNTRSRSTLGGLQVPPCHDWIEIDFNLLVVAIDPSEI